MKANMLIVLGILFPSLAAAQGAPSQNSEQAWNARPKIEIIASVAMVHPFRFEDRGFGNHLNFGAGVRVSINRHLSIRPEIRFLDGTSMSSLNLSQWRFSVGAGFGW